MDISVNYYLSDIFDIVIKLMIRRVWKHYIFYPIHFIFIMKSDVHAMDHVIYQGGKVFRQHWKLVIFGGEFFMDRVVAQLVNRLLVVIPLHKTSRGNITPQQTSRGNPTPWQTSSGNSTR